METTAMILRKYSRRSLFLLLFVMIATSALLFSGQYLYFKNKSLFVAVVVAISAADIFAYFGGKLFGKNRLAPRISPGKTWEGFFAGLSASVLVFVCISTFKLVSIPFEQALLLGILLSFTSVGGDLFESKIKREFDVKDSGNLLGAHGGIFDRFDSYVFSIPITTLLYYLLH